MVKNMKNKSGFTLIELIVTIGIMILIGLVIVNNMAGFLSKKNDQEYENFKQKLEESACIYVETVFSSEERNNCKNNGCTITVDNLIKRGYIEDSLKDPNTGELITRNKDKYKINVRWVNNVKTCRMNG